MGLESTDIGLVLATDVGDVANLQTQSKQLVGAVNEVKAIAELGGEEVGSIVPTNFVIAPSNAINKERADLVLTGVPADDVLAINNAITTLHNARESTDVAIRIDFLGGQIDVGTKNDGSAIEIVYENFHLYGNGVTITGEVEDLSHDMIYYVVLVLNNTVFDGFNVLNTAEFGSGAYVEGGIIKDCTANAETPYGLYLSECVAWNCLGVSNSATGLSAYHSKLYACKGVGVSGIFSDTSILNLCEGSSTEGIGIEIISGSLNGCTGTGPEGINSNGADLFGCKGSSLGGAAIYSFGPTIVIGCRALDGAIYIEGAAWPDTLALLEAFNKGVVVLS